MNFDSNDWKNRKIIERSYCHLEEWHTLAARCDKQDLACSAAVNLYCVITWAKAFSDTT